MNEELKWMLLGFQACIAIGGGGFIVWILIDITRMRKRAKKILEELEADHD